MLILLILTSILVRWMLECLNEVEGSDLCSHMTLDLKWNDYNFCGFVATRVLSYLNSHLILSYDLLKNNKYEFKAKKEIYGGFFFGLLNNLYVL